jgi:hypothetical protein
MINKDFDNFDSNKNDESKMLWMAIAIITSMNEEERLEYIRNTPSYAFDKIVDLANRVYHEEEWLLDRKNKQKINNRLSIIEDLNN